MHMKIDNYIQKYYRFNLDFNMLYFISNLLNKRATWRYFLSIHFHEIGSSCKLFTVILPADVITFVSNTNLYKIKSYSWNRLHNFS